MGKETWGFCGGMQTDGVIACDWWYGEVQLFWRKGTRELDLPCSCVEVELYPVDAREAEAEAEEAD